MCLLANTSHDKPSHLTKSLICLPMKTPGIILDRKIDKLGMRASDTAIIHFDNVRHVTHVVFFNNFPDFEVC